MTKSLLLTAAAVCASLTASASLATGQWRQYPVFGQTMEKVVDSPRMVYYVTGGTLYSYDKEAGETRNYLGTLSDNAVDKIWYNQDDKSLFIAYENANIDYLYEDGSVVNIPDIKDASVDLAKRVNGVDFYKGRSYVATSFGLVILDDKRHDVVQSGIYNVNVAGAVVLGDRILINTSEKVTDTGRTPYYTIPLSGRINTLANFQNVEQEQLEVLEMRPIDRELGRFVAHTRWGVSLRQITPEGSKPMGLNQYEYCSNLIDGKDGAVYFTHVGKLMKMEPNGAINKVASVPDILGDDILALWDGPASVWAGSGTGLANYKLGDDGSVTVLSEKYRPSDGTTPRVAALFEPRSDGHGFFISNHSQTSFRPGEDEGGRSTAMSCDYIDAGTITNVDLKEGASYDEKNTRYSLQQIRSGDGVLGPTFVLSDPDDPETLWMGSAFEGIYVVKNGKQTAKFYGGGAERDNAPWNPWWGSHAQAGAFDSQGNLWVGQWDIDSKTPGLAMLPAAKRRSPATAKRSDWLTFPVCQSPEGLRDMLVLPCRRSNTVFWTAQHFKAPLVVIDTKGTDKTADDVSRVWETFVDQDGKSYRQIERTALVEDLDGRVWMATNEGIFEFANPTAATDADFRVNHLKVPRNDGTNLADYLLPTDVVTGMSVDGSNRKWIATSNSGVYLVSPRGDEIIEHFTTANSPLSTNAVAGIYADPESNSVFIGTVNGLYEYSSDGSPAMDSYDDVYAYPNPVTPDYGGWITIKNLMGNSLVKICDSSMATVAQMTSEGGMALWDGCDLSGHRVRSGVYYVVASNGTDSSSSSNGGVVAKILVIN